MFISSSRKYCSKFMSGIIQQAILEHESPFDLNVKSHYGIVNITPNNVLQYWRDWHDDFSFIVTGGKAYDIRKE